MHTGKYIDCQRFSMSAQFLFRATMKSKRRKNKGRMRSNDNKDDYRISFGRAFP